MGLAVTAALVTSSANFVLPPSNILAGAVCVELDNNPAGASNLEALQVILSDQPDLGLPRQQHFLLRKNLTTPSS